MSTDATHITLADLQRLKHRASGFSFLPRQPVHSILSGRHASRLRGRGLNFEELRRYFPGDDIRTIDWHVTARTRKPHVRVYTEERDRPLLLLVDQRRSMFFGSRRTMKSCVAAEAAAIASWRALRSGDRVGALVFDDVDVDEFVPHRSERQVLQILQSIAQKNQALRADSDVPLNPHKINQVLEQASRLVPHDALVCLISDAAGADAESVRHITRIAAHNDVLSIFVSDPLETDLPDAGHLTVAEGSLRLEVDTSSQSLRERFRSDAAERLARMHDLSLQRQIPVLPLSTAEDVVTQVRRQLGGRLRARRP
jgi:uncharacterized protein (DUF58 family)